MNGILIIDKPTGLTSHDVVARVRRILRTKRVGHTGTLDPFATGVMVVLIGKATRLAQFLDKDEKAYEAQVAFGFETDTGDRTGKRKDRETGRKGDWETVETERIKAVLTDFRGPIRQTPPMFSAKKVEGKKLYELARKGVEIERSAVEITIHELEVIGENLAPKISEIGLHVTCSAGTYIRVLAEDIGRRLGVGAHLAELRRTRAGKFEIRQAVSLEDLEKLAEAGEIEKVLIRMNDAIGHLPFMKLDAGRVEKTINGLSSRFERDDLDDGQFVRMLDENNELSAVGIFRSAEKIVQPKLVLV